jgi:hypothetical protein
MRRTALFFLLPAFGALPAISQSVPGYAIPNTKHYRESGVGNATGRSGSAHLTARALLGQDGNTTIEVSTGTLDSNATPPGSFKKVQFKPLDPNGNAMFAQNFTQLSTDTGYYSFDWPSLYRHQQAQIQGNITGIDSRTDVVTVVDTVKLRPDLAVQNLTLPDSAIISTPVVITANIVEQNGDSSATTTCQLLVDGAIADQASNVYVDAAGSVSCSFSYTFTSTGGHTVQVTAANVMPADWDTANNSVSGNINIVNLNAEIAEHGTASFTDQNGGLSLSHFGTYQAWLNGSLGWSQTDSTTTTGREQISQAMFHSGACAGKTNAVPYQFPVTVAYTEAMDGTQVYSVTDTGITGQTKSYSVNQDMCDSTAVTYVTQLGSDVASDHIFRVISQSYYDSNSTLLQSYQEVDASRNAGDVTYFSSQYECDWWSNCNNPPSNYYYAWNTTSESTYGTLVTLGSTWVPNVTVTDAGGNGFGGSLGVSLFTNQITTGRPNKCTNSGPDVYGYTYQNCTSSLTSYTLTQGNASY